MQAGGPSLGSRGGSALSPSTFSAFTKTGMTAPVNRSKDRWPIASKTLAIAPEWLVNDRNAPSSCANTSSRSCASLYRLAFLGSR